jgi:hypothetical protein
MQCAFSQPAHDMNVCTLRQEARGFVDYILHSCPSLEQAVVWEYGYRHATHRVKRSYSACSLGRMVAENKSVEHSFNIFLILMSCRLRFCAEESIFMNIYGVFGGVVPFIYFRARGSHGIIKDESHCQRKVLGCFLPSSYERVSTVTKRLLIASIMHMRHYFVTRRRDIYISQG